MAARGRIDCCRNSHHTTDQLRGHKASGRCQSPDDCRSITKHQGTCVPRSPNEFLKSTPLRGEGEGKGTSFLQRRFTLRHPPHPASGHRLPRFWGRRDVVESLKTGMSFSAARRTETNQLLYAFLSLAAFAAQPVGCVKRSVTHHFSHQAHHCFSGTLSAMVCSAGTSRALLRIPASRPQHKWLVALNAKFFEITITV